MLVLRGCQSSLFLTRRKKNSVDDSHDTSEWLLVGERIRAARTTAGLSIRELGRRIDVSASHVSQVERGLASFSVRALYNVVSVLHISMDGLFEEVVDSTGAIPVQDEVLATERSTSLDEAGIVLRGSGRPSISLKEGPRWERLTAKIEDGAEFLEVVYAPAPGAQPPAEFIRHGGREYGVIIAGVLNAQVRFGEAQMHPGDSIAFDSSIPHRFWNSSDTEVRAIWFVLDERNDHGSTIPGDSAVGRRHDT